MRQEVLAAVVGLVFSVSLILPSTSSAQAVETFSDLGIYGGMVEDIAFVPGSPGSVFAATYEGDGVYRSGDGGANWKGVAVDNDAGPADTFKNNDVFQIAVAPSDPGVVYVVHNDWVDISTDGGATWINVLNATMQRDCTDCGGAEDDLRLCQTVAVDPTNSAVAYVGTVGPHDTYAGGAIYKTTDTGLTWQKLNGGADFDFAVKDLAVDPQDPSIVWAVTSSEGIGGFAGSLYRSADGGATWTPVFSLTPYGSSFFTVAVKPNDSNTVFTGSGFGILKHVFAEGAWTFETDNTTRLAYDLAFDPQDPETLYATWMWPTYWGGDGVGKVSRSIDGGASWQVFAHEYEFNSLAVDPSNPEVLLAGDFARGVFRSIDHGQTWSPSGEGITAVTVYDVAVDPADTHHLLAGTGTALLERTTSDGPWSVLLDAPIRSIRFHPTNSQIIYAGTSQRGLAKTADGGATWTYTTIPGPLGTGNNDITAIAIDPSDTDTLFVAVLGLSNYGEIHKSTDGGQTLTKVLDGVNLSGESYPFNTVVIDPFDSDHVFAGGGSFYVPKILGDLWESTDGGASWARNSLRDDTEETRGVIVNALLMDPNHRGLVYAGTGYSSESFHPLHVSSDGGGTWTPLHEGIVINSYNAVKDLEFHREDTHVLYAATLARGIYVSANGGGNWLNLGTPEFHVRAIAVGSLYSATEGGLYQLTGTGCIFGDVADAATSGPIDGADVFDDVGIHSATIGGEYILISPAGVHDVTATADGYADATHAQVTLPGGDAVRRDFSLQPGNYAVALTDSAAPLGDRVLSFGNVPAGETAEILVAVANQGDATFTLGGVDESGELGEPFLIVDDTCSGSTLAPAGACTFRVRFDSADEGQVTGSFSMSYGDATGESVTVTVYANTNDLPAPALTWPEPDAVVSGDSVEFRWTGSLGPDDGVGHYLYCSTDPQFGAEPPYEVAGAASAGVAFAGIGAAGLLLGLLRPGVRRRRLQVVLYVILMGMGSMLGSCSSGGGGGDETSGRQMSRTVTGLEAGATYYWKVVMDDGAGGHVESEVRAFTTQ